jgi:hypothetical protein
MGFALQALAIPAGLVLTGWGLRTSADEQAPGWRRWLAAAAAPAGILMALAGTVGVAVPGFYAG